MAMGEVLTQSEIEELLKALANSGKAEAPRAERPKTAPLKAAFAAEPKGTVQRYDFARPSKFGKEQMHALGIMFGEYAQALSLCMTAFLRAEVHVDFGGAEQVPYGEFTSAMAEPVVLGILEVAPTKGCIILELSANIGYSIIDRILGGTGSAIEEMRPFSEIEKGLLERMMAQAAGLLAEPWKRVDETAPRLERVETSAQMAQVVPPGEMTVLAALPFRMGEAEGTLNVCIPYTTIAPMLDRLDMRQWQRAAADKPDASHAKALEAQLESAAVEVAAIVGRTRITVNGLMQLQAGDIIHLDSHVDSDMQVMVGDVLKFYAKPGTSRGKNAVRITAPAEREG